VRGYLRKFDRYECAESPLTRRCAPTSPRKWGEVNQNADACLYRCLDQPFALIPNR
jgi:hypothetical protein